MYHVPNWNEYVGKQPQKQINADDDLTIPQCIEKLTISDLEKNTEGTLEDGNGYIATQIHKFLPSSEFHSRWLFNVRNENDDVAFYIVIAYKDGSLHTDDSLYFSPKELQDLALLGNIDED